MCILGTRTTRSLLVPTHRLREEGKSTREVKGTSDSGTDDAALKGCFCPWIQKLKKLYQSPPKNSR
jgi:hypothetical protein